MKGKDIKELEKLSGKKFSEMSNDIKVFRECFDAIACIFRANEAVLRDITKRVENLETSRKEVTKKLDNREYGEMYR